MAGRGAWPRSGAGGTLNGKGDGPGLYYRAPAEGSGIAMPGSGGRHDASLDNRAVHYAVRAIQRRVNTTLPRSQRVAVDGHYGKVTAEAVTRWQSLAGITSDGIFGPQSARTLFLPQLRSLVGLALCDLVCGFVQNESNWDPGAVGQSDPNDLGLAQINGPSNPAYTEAERFHPSVAFTFVHGRLIAALEEFADNEEDAIASYNLGDGGARAWIKAGRPDSWTPAGSSSARHMGGPNCEHTEKNGYIDRVATACASFA